VAGRETPRITSRSTWTVASVSGALSTRWVACSCPAAAAVLRLRPSASSGRGSRSRFLVKCGHYRASSTTQSRTLSKRRFSSVAITSSPQLGVTSYRSIHCFYGSTSKESALLAAKPMTSHIMLGDHEGHWSPLGPK